MLSVGPLTGFLNSTVMKCAWIEFSLSLLFTFFASIIRIFIGKTDYEDESISYDSLVLTNISISMGIVWYSLTVLARYLRCVVLDSPNAFIVGHISPIITYASSLSGEISIGVACIYTAYQFLGALAGAGFANLTSNRMDLAMPKAGDGTIAIQAIFSEMIICFIFTLIILILCLKRTVTSKEDAVTPALYSVGLYLNAIGNKQKITLESLYRATCKKATSNEPTFEDFNSWILSNSSSGGVEPPDAYNVQQVFNWGGKETLSFIKFRKLLRMSVDFEKKEEKSAFFNSLSFESVLVGFLFGLLCVIGLPLSGASFNPASSTAVAIFTQLYNALYIYWVAPYLGAFLAAIMFMSISHHTDTNKV